MKPSLTLACSHIIARALGAIPKTGHKGIDVPHVLILTPVGKFFWLVQQISPY